MQNFAIQNDGKNENRYWTFDKRKNGTGNPSIRSPDSFATAMPSTLLCEKENNKSDTIMLSMFVSIQVNIIINKDHLLREKQSMRMTDIIKEIIEENPNRENK